MLGGAVLVVASQQCEIQTQSATVYIPDTNPAVEVEVSRHDLHPDQVLSADTSLPHGSGRFSVLWLSRVLLSGDWSESPSIRFVVDGFSNYTIVLETNATSADVTVHETVETYVYYNVGFFPTGALFLLSAIAVLLSMAPNPFCSFRDPVPAEPEKGNSIPRHDSAEIDKTRALIAVLVLVVAFLALTITDPMYVHNDSVGGGKTGPPGRFEGEWNYVAWGYVDFADMVKEDILSSNYSLSAWQRIHGSWKGITLSLIAGAVAALTGQENVVLLTLIARISFVALAGLIGLIAFYITRKRVSFYLAVLITLTNPILLEYSRSQYQEIPAVAMLAASLFFMLRSVEHGRDNLVWAMLFIGLAASTKDILIVAPFLLGVLTLFVVEQVKNHRNWKTLGWSFVVIAELGASAVLFHLILFPLKWTNPIGKLGLLVVGYGVSPAAGIELALNAAFLAIFLLGQYPPSNLLLLICAPFVFRAKKATLLTYLPLIILIAYVPFELADSSLLQHHVIYSLWTAVLTSSLCVGLLAGDYEFHFRHRIRISTLNTTRIMVAILVVDSIAVMPALAYSGLYRNPLGQLEQSYTIFEPTYGLSEAALVVSTISQYGYVITTGAAHVLSYYLPGRGVIYAPNSINGTPSTLTILATISSAPIGAIVLHQFYVNVYPVEPVWITFLKSSPAFAHVGTIYTRGQRTVDLFVPQYKAQDVEGSSLLAGHITYTVNGSDGTFSTLGNGSIMGSFKSIPTEISPGWAKVGFDLDSNYTLDQALLLLRFGVIGNSGSEPTILVTIWEGNSSCTALLQPLWRDNVTLVCRLSHVMEFRTLSRVDTIELMFLQSNQNPDLEFNLTISEARLQITS